MRQFEIYLGNEEDLKRGKIEGLAGNAKGGMKSHPEIRVDAQALMGDVEGMITGAPLTLYRLKRRRRTGVAVPLTGINAHTKDLIGIRAKRLVVAQREYFTPFLHIGIVF